MVGCQSTPRPARPDAQLPVPQNSKQAPSDTSSGTGITNTDPTILLTLAQRERDLNRTLRQAEQHLAAGSTDRALGLLNAVEYYGLSEAAVARLHLLRAKSYAQAGNYFTAYQALGSIELTTNEHWSLLQKICSQLSFPRCRANSLIAIQATNIRTSQLQQDDIFHALLDAQRAPDYEDLQLATAQITPIPEPDSQTHRGWHALADILTTNGSRRQTHQGWLRWQTQWPNHPAATTPPTFTAQLAAPANTSVALMLPLTGRLSNAGRAVRDGFIAAYLAASNGSEATDTTELHIFDSAKHSGLELIRLARGVRADVLVGPLLKANVDAFTNFALASETPTLLLNYLPESRPDETGVSSHTNLLQLGTAIEDEARTLAAHMQINQHQRVMVIHNNSAWARRALSTFREEWPQPIFATDFDNLKQLTNAVGKAMEVAESASRKERVTALLKEPVEFLPRARQDLDAVVALTTGFEAAALTPALQFHFADHLPVYATSQSLRGASTSQGFTTTELPALTQPSNVERDLIDAFSLGNNSLVELYALGLSAFQMATWTPLLSAPSDWREYFTVQSPIGQLRLTKGGRLQRTLAIKNASPNQNPGQSGTTGSD